MSSETVPLKGFDFKPGRSLRTIEVNEVLIGSDIYNLQCEVVHDKSMSYAMVLGRDWLSQVDLTV